MNLNKQRLFSFLLAGILASCILNGQSTYDLNFQGRLIDIKGEGIANESFDLKIQVEGLNEKTILFEMKGIPSTNEEGWFGFAIGDITQYVLGDGKQTNSLLIKMEFLPNELTKWMGKGEDFLVNYTLMPVKDSTVTTWIMTRMEGSHLVVHAEEDFYAFKDQIPFGYLLGGFILTDKLSMNEQVLEDFKQWLSPEPQEEGGSRGVKGSFPSGGYYRKK